MFGFHFGKRHERVVAILDIGSSSVVAAIVVLSPHNPTSVRVSLRRMLSFEKREPRAAVHAIIGLMRETLSRVTQEYATSADARTIDECYAVLHTPWARSRTLVAMTHDNNPMRVTNEMINVLAQNAIRSESGLDYPTLFESTVTHVALDGYSTNAPVGKTARRIEVGCLLSGGNASVIKATQETLRTICPEMSSMHSAVRIVCTAVRKILPDTSDYLIVDVEGDETSMTAIRDGMITEQANVPEGLRSILDRIGGDGLPEDTLTAMRMVARDACASTTCTTIQAAMARVEPDLVRIFAEGMARMGTVHKMPNTLVLVAHSDLREWLTQCFARIDFAQFTITARPFTVKSLSADEFAPYVRSSTERGVDVGIATAAAVVNSESQKY